MRFFYEIILKFKIYFIIGLVFLFSFLINDFVLVSFVKVRNTNDLSSSRIAFEKIDPTNNNSDDEKSYVRFKVDIKGEVKKPGVYEVDEESNVMDLINLAGGLTKNAYTANINLSKKLKSENVIIISNKKDVSKNSTVNCKQVGTTLNSNAHLFEIKNDAEVQNQELVNNNSQNDETAQNNSFDAETKLISINNASLEELQMIPGIGEAKALNILEYREENCFNSIEDIKNVSGIGDSLFEKIKDYISL